MKKQSKKKELSVEDRAFIDNLKANQNKRKYTQNRDINVRDKLKSEEIRVEQTEIVEEKSTEVRNQKSEVRKGECTYDFEKRERVEQKNNLKISSGFSEGWYKLPELKQEDLEGELKDIARHLELIVQPESYGFEVDLNSCTNYVELRKKKQDLLSIGVKPESIELTFTNSKLKTDTMIITLPLIADNVEKTYGFKELESPSDNWEELAKEVLRIYRTFVPPDLLRVSVKYLDDDSKKILNKLVMELNQESSEVRTKINEVTRINNTSYSSNNPSKSSETKEELSIAKLSEIKEELLTVKSSEVITDKLDKIAKYLVNQINTELKRLGISVKQSREMILAFTGKQDRMKLTFGNVYRYLEYLKQLPTPKNDLNSNDNVIEHNIFKPTSELKPDDNLVNDKTTKPHQVLNLEPDYNLTEDNQTKPNQDLNLNTDTNLRDDESVKLTQELNHHDELLKDKTIKLTQELELNTDTNLREDKTVQTNLELNLDINTNWGEDKTVKPNQDLNLNTDTNLTDDENAKLTPELNLNTDSDLGDSKTTKPKQELNLNPHPNLRDDEPVKLSQELDLNTDTNLRDDKTTKPHQELNLEPDYNLTEDNQTKPNQELDLNTDTNLTQDKTFQTNLELNLDTGNNLRDDEPVKLTPELNLNTDINLREDNRVKPIPELNHHDELLKDKTTKPKQELNLNPHPNLRDDESVKLTQELNLNTDTNLREDETVQTNLELNLDTDTNWGEDENVKPNQELELKTVPNSRENETIKINDTLKLNTDYKLIENDEDLKKEIALLKNENVLGIDTETTGLDPHIHKIRLIQVATSNYPTIIIDCFKCNVKLIQPLLITSAIKIFHNAKFDLQFFLAIGLKINQKIFDTQIAYQLIKAGNEKDNTCSLKSVVFELLNKELNKDEQVSDWSKDILSHNQLTYAAKDVEVLLPLRDKLKLALNQFGLNRVAKIEFDCIHAVANIEFNGMLLNLEQWQKSIQDTIANKIKIEAELQKLLTLPSEENTLFKIETTIDLNSTKQVKEALNKLGIKVESTAFNTLSKLAPDYEVIQKLLEYRKLTKLLTSFGDNLTKKINPITGRLHPSLWQCGSSSGRFSCSNPNLQQIPRSKEIRSCFIASPAKKLVIADYSQIELRIAAEFANDSRMIDAYQRGEDLHKLTASLILNKPIEEITKEDRQIAKSANFGLIYGSSVKGFRSYAESNYGIKLSEEEATKIHSNFFKAYKGLAKWHKQTKSRVYNQGLRETRTLSNRRRLLENPTPQQVLNTPVQGTGADMLKLALARLPLALKDTGALIIGTVHDEIILECPEDSAPQVASILSEVMETSGREFLTKVPVIADATICDNWSEK